MAANGCVSRLRLVLRLARRELRAGFSGLGVFLACLALGVGAIAAVGQLGASVEGGLARDAKRLHGGDVSISRSHVAYTDEERSFFEQSGRVTVYRRLRAMARNEAGEAASALVEVKAVDGNYPLYGRMLLEDGGDLSQALTERDGVFGAVAEPALARRLGLEPGDIFSLGRARLRLTGLIAKEPDKAASFFGLGPRLMVAAPALDASGLDTRGSVVRHVLKLRLPLGTPVDLFMQRLKERFPAPGWRATAYGDAATGLSRAMGNLTMYLSLVGLATLLVGGIGVANAVRGFLEGKTLNIATMKCLGATRATVVGVYLTQTLALGLAGTALGVALGLAGGHFAAAFLAARLDMSVQQGFYLAPVASALGFGLLTTLAFSLWPLSAAGRVPPARLFRGYGDAGLRRPTPLGVAGVVLAGLGLVGLTLAGAASLRVAAGFCVGVLVCVGLFFGLSWLLKSLARGVPRGFLRRAGPRVRQAVAGIHRPGAATGSVVFSLGLGLTVLISVSLSDGALQDQLARRMPEMAPSFFFLDVPSADIDPFRADLAAVEGVERMEAEPSLRGRITAIDGVPAQERDIDPDHEWAIRSDRGLTYAAAMPEDVELTAGSWWPEDYDGPPIICLDADMAASFGIGVGDTLTVNVLGREVTATLAALRKIDYTTLKLNHSIVFAPGAVDRAPHAYIATAYADAAGEDAVRRLMADKYPNVAVVFVRDVLEDVSGILRGVSLAIRVTALAALAAGLMVLAEAFRTNLRARRREAVIFKVLGATRADVAMTLALEFCLVGLAAALVAVVLGGVGSWVFVSQVMDATWRFRPLTVAGIVGLGVAASLLIGLIGVRRTLTRKAWPILRNE